VKRDDLTSPRYGGNKVRKLERVLDVARENGASRIVTVGAAGSHHVLATSLYARELGIDVDAVLVPQPRTAHVVENLRAIYARARIWPAASFPHAATIIVDRVACGAFYVPAGGSTEEGALAYVDAAREFLGQVDAGELPQPKVVVATLGSGGTVGGLAAGFALFRPGVRIIGVTVSEPRGLVARSARRLASACVRQVASGSPERAIDLEITDRYLGRGYGYATPACEAAIRMAAGYGLTLDATYTGKACAAALDRPPSDDPVLFWHTLSSAPMAPLLEGAPAEADLPEDVRALLV
jgi:1-aminocyclopropane-1-carboxylate deaminase/D-cysteine desulfhydrase-like pyridoxal-dependent ACC family enzyme